MNKPLYPKVTLVGAGPGDLELITLKGIRALQTADVVLYDALVNPDLLAYAPDEAPAIFVGKRYNQHAFTQDEINQIIVDMAQTYGHVVRLKGGDSFVFGRGYEEMVFAREKGVEATVIPGISSAIAVPELQHIPLTHRGVSESFWILTGTTRHGKISADIQLAAQSSATAVILMGVHQLREICAVYQYHEKGSLPVAIIQNGSLPDERFVLGEVDTIEAIATQLQIGSPAIIVLGEVVKAHPAWVETQVRQMELSSPLPASPLGEGVFFRN